MGILCIRNPREIAAKIEISIEFQWVPKIADKILIKIRRKLLLNRNPGDLK